MPSSENARVFRRAAVAALAFGLLVSAGTASFSAVGESLEEAFFRSLGTFTGAGYVASPDTTVERALAATLTVVGGLFYLLLVAGVVDTLLRRVLAEYYRDRRMKDRIADLREHVVVCGYGRVGRAVVASLVEAERDVVVVEQNEANWPDVEEEFASGRPVYLVKGDADDSDVLRRAGVPRAAGLVACVGSDAENMYIAFAARRCNESIRIVVRASDEDAERNLRQAEGLLTAAITPYRSAGAELARAVTSP